MAYMQIGDNLYADELGKYYNLNNGNYANVASPFDTQQQKLNELYDNQRKNQLDALRQQRDKAVAGFNQQKQDLRPQYQNQRNQADVVNAQNVTRLRELMAANGINASGESLTTQAQLASSRQDAFRDINNNENQAIGAIDRQIAAENDPSREQAIINDVETQRSAKQADLLGQWQQEIYQRYQDWRNYQMQKAQFDLEQQQRQLELQKMQQALAAGSGGGSGGRRSSSKKTTTPTVTKGSTALDAAYNAYSKTKPSVAMTALDKYYSAPAVQAGLNTGSKYFSNPLPPAQNPNLTAWDKMKMLGL